MHAAIRAHDASGLRAFTRRAAQEPGVVRVEVLDNSGHQTAASGPIASVAYARVGLTENTRPVGALRVSTTTADE